MYSLCISLILAIKQILNSDIEHADKLMSGSEIDLVTSLVEVLEPFYKFTKILSGSKYSLEHRYAAPLHNADELP